MAFHQTTRQISQRVVRVDPTSSESESRVAAPLDQSRDGSQTWVLFPPATDAGTSTSYFSSVQDDQPTPGRSRISDLGSLQTIAHSDYILSEPAHTEIAGDDEPVEDDAELDSLDSHLPDFIHPGGLQQSTTILPGHDGLGSFRIDSRALAADMQEQMYQFERYNPRRVKRRRESLELGQLALESEEAQEAARRRRIEEWRLEHSRILLEEIQKETRRRRESTVSALTNKLRRGSQASTLDTGAEEAALSTVDDATTDPSVAGTEWHDQDASELALGSGESDEAGLWSRITRKVIRDLMGLDDRLLCVLFGEALPEDLDLEADDLSSTPKASAQVGSETDSSSSWQLHVLDRIARELGHLVNQLSAHPHPGAFSTYVRMQQQPLPYAGLPAIPEIAAVPAPAPTTVDAEHARSAQRRASSFSVSEEASAMPALPQFQPTLQSIPHSRPMDIPGAKNAETLADVSGGSTSDSFTQQEWEQDLDIKLVFRYLRNRFTSSRPSQPSSQAPTSPETAAARAAARVRQHHPLVHQRRKSFKVSGGPSVPSQIVHPHGSCASQSTRRSGRRGSLSVSSSRHSSRHFWDIGVAAGGSVCSGSLIASTGPMGSWGEV
ncbi:hypothetical protein N0V93_000862 [Gnomoniopsis smithogilvyi]|uniref:Uncharacterized protein n=1 Tax=Gnomoniopsis smithogilvyi TaxID=1191159 RepID=A0A9W8Z0I8_9PEZI|nr:hypothetical protein N0V93_000862 [Gnomoniopsis smithogilvyi]